MNAEEKPKSEEFGQREIPSPHKHVLVVPWIVKTVDLRQSGCLLAFCTEQKRKFFDLFSSVLSAMCGSQWERVFVQCTERGENDESEAEGEEKRWQARTTMIDSAHFVGSS
ncbi:hypothetical protein RRG08_032959 [Elysia crispata]|uniref:Uncharacterized protein n=1 Tax=Elysia crispata TaxID=231223 RepID=A0AAE0YSL6_9GAST|nr:hypothetical protein RRG08_032959 [Elysia crispata]